MSRNSASSTIRLAKHKGFWINISLECTSSIPFTPKIRRSRVLGIQNETSWKWPSCKIASNTHFNRTPTHLIVPANSEQRRTSSENIFRWNLCKLLKDELVPNHLLCGCGCKLRRTVVAIMELFVRSMQVLLGGIGLQPDMMQIVWIHADQSNRNMFRWLATSQRILFVFYQHRF